MRHKSKRSKLTDISEKVRKVVYERDKGLCVVCGKTGIPNGHFIRRSQGGLGIEQNIVTLCPICHNNYDNGFYRQEIYNIIAEYLKGIYGATWCERDLVYNKWKDFEIK